MRHTVDQSCRTAEPAEAGMQPDKQTRLPRTAACRCRVESAAGDLYHFIFLFKKSSSQGRAREVVQGLVISHGPTDNVWERRTILPRPNFFSSVYPPPWIAKVIVRSTVDLYPYVRNCEPVPPALCSVQPVPDGSMQYWTQSLRSPLRAYRTLLLPRKPSYNLFC